MRLIAGCMISPIRLYIVSTNFVDKIWNLPPDCFKLNTVNTVNSEILLKAKYEIFWAQETVFQEI